MVLLVSLAAVAALGALVAAGCGIWCVWRMRPEGLLGPGELSEEETEADVRLREGMVNLMAYSVGVEREDG